MQLGNHSEQSSLVKPVSSPTETSTLSSDSNGDQSTAISSTHYSSTTASRKHLRSNPPPYEKERQRKKKKHISFNTFVEQCIAIETPQASPSRLGEVSEENEGDGMDVDMDLDRGDQEVLGRSVGRNALNGRVVRIEYRDDDDSQEEDVEMDGFENEPSRIPGMDGRGQRYAMGRNPWGPGYDDGRVDYLLYHSYHEFLTDTPHIATMKTRKKAMTMKMANLEKTFP
jgi:hypothetical protein